MFLKKKHNPDTPFNVDIILILVFLLCSLFCAYFLLRPQQQSGQVKYSEKLASLLETNREVRLRRRSDFRWKDVSGGETLGVKDRIFTGEKSQAKISVLENQVDLLENSLLEITADADHDLKLEYGFLKITFSDRPIRLKFKNKVFAITGEKGKVLGVNTKQDEVDFFGEEKDFKIMVTGEDEKVVIRKVNTLNSGLCSTTTNNEFLTRAELCPSCEKESKLFYWSEKEKDFISFEESQIELIKGENKFKLEGQPETCVIIRKMSLNAPTFQKWMNKTSMSHETGAAFLEVHLLGPQDIGEGFFKLEISQYPTQKITQLETSQSGRFKLSFDKHGDYKMRGQFCLAENECSEFSSSQGLRVELPPVLEAPQLKKNYKLKVAPPLPRNPNNSEILSFSPISGAKTYEILISKTSNGEGIFEQTISLPEFHLPQLVPDHYLLSITPIDTWGRRGKTATSEILVEEIPEINIPSKQSHQELFNSLALFGGLHLVQMNQWESQASAIGATYGPMTGSLGYKRHAKQWSTVLSHDFYTLKADSNNKTRSKLLHESSLGIEKNNSYFGFSRIDIPYFTAEEGDFSINSDITWQAEVGYSLKELFPRFDFSARLRKSISTTGQVEESLGILLKVEHRTVLLKNGLTWYNGLDLRSQFSSFKYDGKRSENLLFREFLKTGLFFEF